MNVTDRGLAIIKRYEGCRLKAYKDPVGVWTIGYGHTTGVCEGMRITQSMADEYLFGDVQNVVNYLNGMHRVWTQNQFDALVSFGFNCGVGNLRKLVSNRNNEEIAEAMLKYKYAGGKVLRGLEKRREEEQRLFMTDPKWNQSPEQFVTGVISNCSALNIRKEPNKSAIVVQVVGVGTEHKIDVDKSVADYWYFTEFSGYGKKDFVTIKE